MAIKGKAGSGDGEDDDLFLPIKDVVTKLKQGPMNFGCYQTSDKDKPVVLAAHKRKNPEALSKLAKKQAGTPKGSYGTLTLEEGGMLTFLCATDDAPMTMKKKIRLMLKAEGFAKFKVRILLPGGAELGEGDDDEDAAETGDAPGGEAPSDAPGAEDDPLAALRAEVQAEFDALCQRIDAAPDAIPPGIGRKIEGLRAMFAAEIARDPRKCAGILTLMRKTLEAAGIGAEGPAPVSGRASRASALADLERGIDALLAEFA